MQIEEAAFGDHLYDRNTAEKKIKYQLNMMTYQTRSCLPLSWLPSGVSWIIAWWRCQWNRLDKWITMYLNFLLGELK